MTLHLEIWQTIKQELSSAFSFGSTNFCCDLQMMKSCMEQWRKQRKSTNRNVKQGTKGERPKQAGGKSIHAGEERDTLPLSCVQIAVTARPWIAAGPDPPIALPAAHTHPLTSTRIIPASSAIGSSSSLARPSTPRHGKRSPFAKMQEPQLRSRSAFACVGSHWGQLSTLATHHTTPCLRDGALLSPFLTIVDGEDEELLRRHCFVGMWTCASISAVFYGLNWAGGVEGVGVRIVCSAGRHFISLSLKILALFQLRRCLSGVGAGAQVRARGRGFSFGAWSGFCGSGVGLGRGSGIKWPLADGGILCWGVSMVCALAHLCVVFVVGEEWNPGTRRGRRGWVR